jgi:ribosomal protein L33
MPTHFCAACKKETAHKAVMRRSFNENGSVFQSFQQVVSQLVHGSSYHKLERQLFCRVCNKQHVEISPQVSAKAVPASQTNLA